MRIVGTSVFRGQLRPAAAEAQNAFGDGRLLLEQALLGARHVEVQVFGDEQGTTVPSRRARLLDPAPASEADRGGALPAVSSELRAVMGAAAVMGRGGRLRRRGHGRVFARRRRALLLPWR